MHDAATLECYVVVNARTGEKTTVTGRRVGDFAVRFSEVMSVATPDGWFVVRDVWVVDHLPTGSSTAIHDEKTAWFVADEFAVNLDGV